MPEITAGLDDGVLAAWLVEESARFDAAQTIAYVETEDELFSVEAGRPGLLLKTLVEAGTRVAPGTPIGVLGEPWEQVHDLQALLTELGVAAQSVPPREPIAVVAELTPLAPRTSLTPVVTPDETEARAEGEADRAAVRGAHAAAAEPDLHHHYLRARVRVDRLVALSAQLERDHPDVSVIDLVSRCVVAAHRQVPQLAVAHADDDRIAVGIPVSHPGRFGVEEAVVAVPVRHSAALAVGAVRDEPVIDGGAVVPGKMITLTLSVRPGRVDDAQASRWLAVLVALLERPEWLRE